jgi:hypothetical protein
VLSLSGGILAAVALATGVPPLDAGCSSELFRIERSLNANVVVYLAVPRKGGGLEPKNPVEAHWIMLADRGQAESLNVLERLTAYGFDLQLLHGGSFAIFLRACRGRPIELRSVDGCPRALLPIQGRLSILASVFVKTRDSGGGHVQFIALRGFEIRTGDAIEEWMRPDGASPAGEPEDDPPSP